VVESTLALASPVLALAPVTRHHHILLLLSKSTSYVRFSRLSDTICRSYSCHSDTFKLVSGLWSTSRTTATRASRGLAWGHTLYNVQYLHVHVMRPSAVHT
jgi:hypothetical protein